MWKKIKNKPYYMHVTIDTKYEVFVTDFVKIWSCCFPKENYVQYLMECEYNYGLEIDNEELLDKGTKILLNPEQLCCASFYERDQQPYGDFLIICLTMDFGFELSIELNLELGSPELYFLKVSQPLLKIVRDLKESENELRKLVAIKDEEIIEYKTQGGKIKYTALRPYNDSEHMSKHQCYNKFFESISDPQNVLSKTIDKCPRRPGREEEEPAENVSIKVEPSSAASSSQASNLTTKEEPTDNTTIKEEPSSEIAPIQANSVTNEEHIDSILVKVEQPSANIDSRQENNIVTTEVEVKKEYKPFMPKKKRLNL
ncbi:uncharacterized protein LOC121726917 isoform X2 [Aricia agestis]|uniref:uncharacterized protein LOC121726917 isoform X2 n=1 Tax=Aricia agestis TaxID=91739 RepID=UPI001C2053E0|nr:uncharacterized protein LOC121726917 isoform X2 [Aricia agestis]